MPKLLQILLFVAVPAILTSSKEDTEEKKWIDRIVRKSDALVQAYDDPKQLSVARNKVPKEIRDMIRVSQHKRRPSDGSIPEYDGIMKLLMWFGREFMQFVHYPLCKRKDCKDSVPVRNEEADFMTDPKINQTTKIPYTWSSHNVEAWKCSSCRQDLHFHRYRDPGSLLKYRSGRCGEFTNLFTFICFALGFEVRQVDSLPPGVDHCWTEIYFQSVNRWVECDPSEMICDTPLMYELGCDEKLSTVVAYSIDEVRDVTRRYVLDYNVAKQLRTVPEHILQKEIQTANEKRQENLPEARLKELRQREKQENDELMSPLTTDIMYSTKLSSALEQKKLSGNVLPDIMEQNGVVWEINEEEMKRKVFQLSYSCLSDTYDRHNKRQDTNAHKWGKGVHTAESIQRIWDDELKICYFARLHGASKASISWKFQLPRKSKDLKIQKVKISIPPTMQFIKYSYVTIVVFSENRVRLLKPVIKDQKITYRTLETEEFQGDSEIGIKVVIAGDTIYWGNLRLFTSSEENEKVFDVVITLANSRDNWKQNVQSGKNIGEGKSRLNTSFQSGKHIGEGKLSPSPSSQSGKGIGERKPSPSPQLGKGVEEIKLSPSPSFQSRKGIEEVKSRPSPSFQAGKSIRDGEPRLSPSFKSGESIVRGKSRPISPSFQVGKSIGEGTRRPSPSFQAGKRIKEEKSGLRPSFRSS